MKAILPAIAFAARHFLIGVFAIIAGCILWTIVYVVLLLVAAIWNLGVGGPLAYPAGIVMVLCAVTFIVWGIFAPASMVGAVFCRICQLPRLAAIPVVFGSAFVLSQLAYQLFIGSWTTHSMPSAWVVLKNYTIFLSVPLGVYWWLTEGPGAIFEMFLRCFRLWPFAVAPANHKNPDNRAIHQERP
jgi:hypothetical protein